MEKLIKKTQGSLQGKNAIKLKKELTVCLIQSKRGPEALLSELERSFIHKYKVTS